MYTELDFARRIQRYVHKALRRMLDRAGIGERTIDASVLRGEIGSGVLLPPHAIEHEAGGNDEIDLGFLAGIINDAQHGSRAGGTTHAAVVAGGDAGFMTGVDKTKLDGITAGAAVTSVALSAPSELAVTGSPGTGAVSISLAWASQAINKVLASPASGSPGALTVRSLVDADLPSGITSTKIGGTANRVAIFDGSGQLTTDAGLTYNPTTDALALAGSLAVDTDTLVVDASNNRVGIKAASPAVTLQIGAAFTLAGAPSAEISLSEDVNAVTGMEFRNLNTGTDADSRFAVSDTTGAYLAFAMPSTGNTGGNIFGLARTAAAFIFGATPAGATARDLGIGTISAKKVVIGTNNTARITTLSTGEVGIGTGAPATRLDIDAGAMRFAEMTPPSAPAANSFVLYADDNGAGKTRAMILFSSGAAQQMAIQP